MELIAILGFYYITIITQIVVTELPSINLSFVLSTWKINLFYNLLDAFKGLRLTLIFQISISVFLSSIRGCINIFIRSMM